MIGYLTSGGSASTVSIICKIVIGSVLMHIGVVDMVTVKVGSPRRIGGLS